MKVNWAATGLADGNASLGGSLDVAEGTPTAAAADRRDLRFGVIRRQGNRAVERGLKRSRNFRVGEGDFS
jgi:hypothetical protein